MALTEEQLALITWLERPNSAREDYEFRSENEHGSAGDALSVIRFEGLGIPSDEDVEAAQLELRAMTDLEQHKLNAERDCWSYERAAE